MPEYARAEDNRPKETSPVTEVQIVGKLRPVCDPATPPDARCSAQRLQEAADTTLKALPPPVEAQTPGPGSADIHTGIASETAIRQRLGSNYGHSVHPPRPSRPPPTPRP